MHVREDLVYDKHEGNLIGFTNLGGINDHLDAYEKLSVVMNSHQPWAKSVLVFMVWGLFTKLQFAYAQFPCSTLAGEKLFVPFWDAVRRLETCGLKVSAVFSWFILLTLITCMCVCACRY